MFDAIQELKIFTLETRASLTKSYNKCFVFCENAIAMENYICIHVIKYLSNQFCFILVFFKRRFDVEKVGLSYNLYTCNVKYDLCRHFM